MWTATGLLVLLGNAVSTLGAQELTEFQVPTPLSSPKGITVGSDGSLWFTETGRPAIGRIATDGTLTEFSIPSGPLGGIVTGRDGALWFPSRFGIRQLLARLTTSGAYSEFPLPGFPDAFELTGGIAASADGNFWLAKGNEILRVTPTGQFREFSGVNGPQSLAAGPDGNIWFTTGQSVGKISSDGAITEYPRTYSLVGGGGLTSGADGNVWVAETVDCGTHHPNTQLCGAISRFSLSGERREFSAPDLGAVNDITNGSDGNLWFTEGARSCHGLPPFGAQCALSPSRLGRITPEGIITQFDLDTQLDSFPSPPDADPRSIVTGPDGNLWFTERGKNSIGRLRPSAGCLSDAHSTCLKDGRFRAQVAWKVTDQGPRGLGAVLPLTADAAAFWFFSANNLEVIVKVVDGRTANGKFWVFVGSLSDVDYEVTVTDTTTGAVRRYSNPPGTLQSLADTSAF